MMDHLKNKHFFSPIAIVFISAIIATTLSRLPIESNTNLIKVMFYSLFIYWIAALVFNIRGFLKHRIPICTSKNN